MPNDVEFLTRVYALFNSREIESVLAAMHPYVVWANGMEGGHVHGREECAAIGNVNGRSSIHMLKFVPASTRVSSMRMDFGPPRTQSAVVYSRRSHFLFKIKKLRHRGIALSNAFTPSIADRHAPASRGIVARNVSAPRLAFQMMPPVDSGVSIPITSFPRTPRAARSQEPARISSRLQHVAETDRCFCAGMMS
jgi:hypothetical protein